LETECLEYVLILLCWKFFSYGRFDITAELVIVEKRDFALCLWNENP
jgi:hypothetical protein